MRNLPLTKEEYFLKNIKIVLTKKKKEEKLRNS